MTESVIKEQTPLVYIIAGEASGDVLAAGLMRSLKKMSAGRVRFAGVGGERMAAEGMNSLFPMSEMAVMGVFEILPHVPEIAVADQPDCSKYPCAEAGYFADSRFQGFHPARPEAAFQAPCGRQHHLISVVAYGGADRLGLEAGSRRGTLEISG